MMIPLLALLQDGDHGAEGFSSPFEVNFGLIFWTWAVFIILFLVLKRFAWPAIVNLTEDRERKIKKELEEAARMNEEASNLLEEHKKLMAGSREEAQSIINEAKQLGQKEREQLLEKAREEQEQMLDRARREISAERDRAVADLRREAVDLSLAAASRLVGEKLDSQSDRELVVDYLSQLGDGR